MIHLKRLNFIFIPSSLNEYRGNIETFFIFYAVRAEDVVYPVYLSHRISESRAEYNSKIINTLADNRVTDRIRNFIYANKTGNITNNQKQTILSQLTSNPKYSTQEEVNAAFDEMVGSKYIQNLPETFLDGTDGSGVFSVQRLMDEGFASGGDRVVSVIRNPLERFLAVFMSENDWGKSGVVNKTAFRNWITNGEFQNLSVQKSQKQYNLLDYNGSTVGEWWCLDHIKQHLKRDFVEYYDIPTINMVTWETILRHNRNKTEFVKSNLDYYQRVAHKS